VLLGNGTVMYTSVLVYLILNNDKKQLSLFHIQELYCSSFDTGLVKLHSFIIKTHCVYFLEIFYFIILCICVKKLIVLWPYELATD